MLETGKNYSNRLNYNFPHFFLNFLRIFKDLQIFSKFPNSISSYCFQNVGKVPQNLIFQSFPKISLKFPQNFEIRTNFFSRYSYHKFPRRPFSSDSDMINTRSSALTCLSEYYVSRFIWSKVSTLHAVTSTHAYNLYLTS